MSELGSQGVTKDHLVIPPLRLYFRFQMENVGVF